MGKAGLGTDQLGAGAIVAKHVSMNLCSPIVHVFLWLQVQGHLVILFQRDNLFKNWGNCDRMRGNSQPHKPVDHRDRKRNESCGT